MDNEALKRLEEKLDRMEKAQKKQHRIRIILLCVAAALLITGIVYVHIRVSAVVKQYNAVMAQLQPVLDAVGSIDTEAISSVLDTVRAIDAEKLNSLFDTLGSIDISSLQSSLENIKAFMGKFEGFDVDSLNTAIENLNKVIAPLSKLFGG